MILLILILTLFKESFCNHAPFFNNCFTIKIIISKNPTLNFFGKTFLLYEFQSVWSHRSTFLGIESTLLKGPEKRGVVLIGFFYNNLLLTGNLIFMLALSYISSRFSAPFWCQFILLAIINDWQSTILWSENIAFVSIK